MGDKVLVVQELIENKIFLIRGKRVMLDRDLAELYGVKSIRLREQVKRNRKRFPADFMVQLNKQETKELIANCDRFKTLKHSSFNPFVFTEQGVAMISSVLNSNRAIEVNIQIMRAFIKLRELIASNKEIPLKISNLEQDIQKNKKNVKIIFNTLNQLISPEKHTVFSLSKTNMKVVNQEIQEALNGLNRKPKPDITGSVQHAAAAVECVVRNITGDHQATLGQILKKRKDIIPAPLDTAIIKMWGYASDKARHVQEGASLDYSEAEIVVTQFISIANFLTKKFK